MGIFWDLMQQSAIQEQDKKTASLTDRVSFLEKELRETQLLLQKTLVALEKHVEQDINGDGKLG